MAPRLVGAQSQLPPLRDTACLRGLQCQGLGQGRSEDQHDCVRYGEEGGVFVVVFTDLECANTSSDACKSGSTGCKYPQPS